jgi:DNA-binding GntR family transcriptional regulator
MRRDADTAARYAREHIQKAHNQVLRALARWPSIISAEVVPLHWIT